MNLPLSALRAHNACDLSARIEAFQAHHGHAPDETSTFAQWAEVTPWVSDLLWALRCVPNSHRVAVEVARRAAMRVLPIFEAAHPGDTRPRAALDLVRRWLDGEPVSVEKLQVAADAARAAAYAAEAARAAAYAASAAADAAAYAAAANARAAAAAVNAYVTAAHAAHAARADTAERAQQRADILALTAGA